MRAVTTTSAPFDARGYVLGEAITVELTFNEAVTVSGSPELAIRIGDATRTARFDAGPTSDIFVAFRYDVTRDDRDDDGIGIAADALDLSEGSIRSLTGVDADPGLTAVPDDSAHLVLGSPPPQACGDERARALQFSRPLVSEWDGSPLRVDFVRNFPDLASEAGWFDRELAAVARLAERIEEQLGYPVIELGSLIEPPVGAPAGWDQDFDAYWRTNPLPRERGQALAFHLNDDNDSWGGEGSPMSAHVCCGTTSYNRRFFQPWHWNRIADANNPEGRAVIHELFHLFGFKHFFDQWDLVGVEMSPGGLDRPWESGRREYYAAWTDIEALGCIFPPNN